jgi:hypothetical protein
VDQPDAHTLHRLPRLPSLPHLHPATGRGDHAAGREADEVRVLRADGDPRGYQSPEAEGEAPVTDDYELARKSMLYGERQLFDLLMAANGATVDLVELVCSTPGSVRVQISRIRPKVAHLGIRITNVYNHGYFVTRVRPA